MTEKDRRWWKRLFENYNPFRTQKLLEEKLAIPTVAAIANEPYHSDAIRALESQKSFSLQIWPIFFALVGTVLTTTALIVTSVFSWHENARENADFQARNRPYLVISNVDFSSLSDQVNRYQIHVKNVGVMPAKMEGLVIRCANIPDEDISDMFGKTIIGNGEKLITEFTLGVEDETSCTYTLRYTAPTTDFMYGPFETRYDLKIHKNDSITTEDASIK